MPGDRQGGWSGLELTDTLAGDGTSINVCSGFLNLLYKRYPTIANPTTPTLT